MQTLIYYCEGNEMNKMEKATIINHTYEKVLGNINAHLAETNQKMPRAERRKVARKLFKEGQGDCFKNEKYQALVRVNPEDTLSPDPVNLDLIHLSIKRLDNGTSLDWSELMQIKDECVSPEFDCIMIFPAQYRIVDAANQYHLFGLREKETGAYVPMQIGWFPHPIKNGSFVTE